TGTACAVSPAGAAPKVPWAIVHPAVDVLPRHPVQLYQAIAEGPLLFALLVAFPYPRHGLGSRPPVACIADALTRIALESFRAPDPEPGIVAMGITNGQLYSL